jgi:ribosomal protein S14
MLRKQYLDKINRKQFVIIEKKKIIYKIVMNNYLSIINNKFSNISQTDKTSKLTYIVCNLNKKLMKISKSKINNRCILTNRRRSINNKYAISRLKMLELMKLGIIPGYKKAVW